MAPDGNTGTTTRLYAVLIPVAIGFNAILAIGAWIGYTMATTPQPKPIEELTAEAEPPADKPKGINTPKFLKLLFLFSPFLPTINLPTKSREMAST